ncbi:heterokaryon incompatibility protein-domain-containing protein [Pisolithus orientalis]|uniref:heterokaryon incompatibility protein-domain-containing protein n=1 Tax=Pisolithus orientalis TaxID=936130 RepID=UPI002225056B|nr:heterokaryon incompatibility protein-domain-containing protein [Pisolithus orientalis]KAI5987984.1 heterokaryon incompatibility protein-domain-containing protein [Pisolithus orientalis]
MKLLDVRAVLERETDIQQTDPEREVLKELDDKGTHYAILSHRWGAEAGYKEMVGLMKMEERKRDEVRRRDGYQKIIKSCEQATNDGYEWLWIDTCCIDKRSSSELSEAINSMYRWYRNAQVCYAYLNDVDGSVFPVRRDVIKFGKSFGWPEWFVRGWTLQELIAPKQVEFFNKDWVSIGNKRRLAPVLQEITGIPTEVLRVGLDVKRLCVAEIMSWAAKRETTRVEDRAYSLMGLFRVNMPMLYGEGEKAFQRLQLEIIRTSNDHSIFAWNPLRPRTGSVLADDPSDFWRCSGIAKLEPNEFADRLMKYIEENKLGNPWYIQRNSTKIATNPIHWCRLAWLRWRLRSLSQPLRTFAISNGGIQVCLPVIPLSNSPFHCRAVLACGYGEVGLVSIDLVSSGSSFDRASDALHLPYIKAYPEFKTLYLTHHQDANEMHRGFALDDKHASYHGFTRRGTYPREFRGDSVTLSSLKDDLIVIVYANDDASSRFAVGLGYYLSQGWVHVFYDEDSPTQGTDWRDFGRRAYYRMGGARADHARNMPKQEHEDERSNDHFIKHAHLPRSIWAARVVWGRREMGNFKLMVDVEQCPGCCDGPRGWTTTSNDWSGLDMPGPMNPVRHTYRLHLDGCQVRLDKCSGQQIALGDYGDYSNGTLICTGNIYEDMRTLGINTMDLADCSTASSKSDYAVPMMENEYDLTVAYHDEGMHLALRRSKGLSLPVNECFVLLLKALSTRAAGKHLVIAVIKCSDFCTFDDDGEQRDSGGEPASDSGSHSREPRVLTPLYAVASPQVWRKEPPCRQRREQFQSIRKHFYALVNMHEITGPRARHKSVVRSRRDSCQTQTHPWDGNSTDRRKIVR